MSSGPRPPSLKDSCPAVVSVLLTCAVQASSRRLGWSLSPSRLAGIITSLCLVNGIDSRQWQAWSLLINSNDVCALLRCTSYQRSLRRRRGSWRLGRAFPLAGSLQGTGQRALLPLSPAPRLASTFLHPNHRLLWASRALFSRAFPARLFGSLPLLMICLSPFPVLLQPGAFATSARWSIPTTTTTSSPIATTAILLPQRSNVAASGPAP
jgi:hypothetical protein